jgi:hypothetical protein
MRPADFLRPLSVCRARLGISYAVLLASGTTIAGLAKMLPAVFPKCASTELELIVLACKAVRIASDCCPLHGLSARRT